MKVEKFKFPACYLAPGGGRWYAMFNWSRRGSSLYPNVLTNLSQSLLVSSSLLFFSCSSSHDALCHARSASARSLGKTMESSCSGVRTVSVHTAPAIPGNDMLVIALATAGTVPSLVLLSLTITSIVTVTSNDNDVIDNDYDDDDNIDNENDDVDDDVTITITITMTLTMKMTMIMILTVALINDNNSGNGNNNDNGSDNDISPYARNLVYYKTTEQCYYLRGPNSQILMTGESDRGSYFIPKKITTSEFAYPKKHHYFL